MSLQPYPLFETEINEIITKVEDLSHNTDISDRQYGMLMATRATLLEFIKDSTPEPPESSGGGKNIIKIKKSQKKSTIKNNNIKTP